MRFASAVAVTFAITLVPVVAGEDAIIRRHDRPDEAYLELAATYGQVAKLGGRMGDGTLVAPEWILTAAHVADGMLRRGSRSVVLAGVEYEAAEFFVHPAWRPMGPHDFALIRLATAARDVAPLQLYTRSDERGRVATLIGHGRHGDGRSGPTGEDGRRRGATNRIETADEQYLVFRFDEGGAATDLEGIPSGGDSGGPAIIDVDGVRYVAGVSSLGRPGRNGPGTYGAEDYFGRVSTHLAWLEDAMGGRARPTREAAAGEPGGEMSRRVGGSPRDEVLMSVVQALRAGSPDDLERAIAAHFSPELQNAVRRGELSPVLAQAGAILRGAESLDLRMRPGATTEVEIHALTAGARAAIVRLRLSADGPPKVIDLAVSGGPPPLHWR